jgi:hypothetical protein
MKDLLETLQDSFIHDLNNFTNSRGNYIDLKHAKRESWNGRRKYRGHSVLQ